MSLSDDLLFRARRKVPVFTSTEAAECGLACIAMVAGYHGRDTDLNALRQRFPSSMAGINLRGVMNIADQLGLSPRALRVDIGELASVQTPAILHWNLNHYVVLSKVGRRSYVIHDPAEGRRVLNERQISGSFTGVLLELEPATDFAPVRDRATVRLTDLWSRSHGIVRSVSLVLVLSLVLQALTFAMPFQMQLVIDQGISRNDPDILAVIAIVFGAVVLLQTVTNFIRDWSISLFANQLVLQLAGNLLRHLLRLPAGFFEKRHVGDLLSRLGATQAIQDVITQGLVSAVLDGAVGIVAGIVLFVYAPLLATIVFASLLIVLLLTAVSYYQLRRLTEQAIRASAVEQSYLMETIRAIPTIKLFGNELTREAAWRSLFVRSMNFSIGAQRTAFVFSSLISGIVGLQFVLIVFLGARQVLDKTGLSLGMFTAFLAYRQTFMDRSLSFVQQSMKIRLVRLQVDRVADIVLHPAETITDEGFDVDRGVITFVDVSFRYGATDKWVLQDVNLQIDPGDFVAITGPSGGGKTTLVKMMLGLQQPTTGSILIDGRPATPQRWRALRAMTGVVSQSDHLFSGSLADNIAFFDPDGDLNRVQAAAADAQIDHEIRQMPMRYNTLVGDMGSSLSGGQRQRLLLARALYRKPRLLLLDEGTANLDRANEEAIADLVEEMTMTRIVVAHRPSLTSRAGRILSIEGGRCREVPRGIDAGENGAPAAH